jgi:hypothetical protein
LLIIGSNMVPTCCGTFISYKCGKLIYFSKCI